MSLFKSPILSVTFFLSFQEKMSTAQQFDLPNDILYAGLIETAWTMWVFLSSNIETEVGYGRLACECPNLGDFIKSFTADLGDDEADGYNPEEERNRETSSQSDSNDNDTDNNYNSSKAKRKSSKVTNQQTKRIKPIKNDAWRNTEDIEWVNSFVERSGNRIYQIPYLQIQTVCFGGLTKLRKVLLREFQTAAQMFHYSEAIFSGSPADILEDFVSSRYQRKSCIGHNLTNQMDPFTWQHYQTPVFEQLCVCWNFCPLDKFNVIPCGNGPFETYKGTTTQIVAGALNKISSTWRKQLASATQLCNNDNYDESKLINCKELLTATYPLKLVYVNSFGTMNIANNMEALRLKFMDGKVPTYSRNPKDECDSDCDEEEQDEKESEKNNDDKHRLDINNPPSVPELDVQCSKWVELLSGGAELLVTKNSRFEEQANCKLCASRKKDLNYLFPNWKAFISSKWDHMCEHHGPLGANTMLIAQPNYIQDYYYEACTQQAQFKLILTTLFKAGFRQCAYREQGNWISFLSDEFRRINISQSSDNSDSE